MIAVKTLWSHLGHLYEQDQQRFAEGRVSDLDAGVLLIGLIAITIGLALPYIVPAVLFEERAVLLFFLALVVGMRSFQLRLYSIYVTLLGLGTVASAFSVLTWLFWG
jgi:hypothetical protein